MGAPSVLTFGRSQTRRRRRGSAPAPRNWRRERHRPRGHRGGGRGVVIGLARSALGVQGQSPCGGWPLASAPASDRWGLPSVRPRRAPDHAGPDLGRARDAGSRPWRARRCIPLASASAMSRGLGSRHRKWVGPGEKRPIAIFSLPRAPCGRPPPVLR